MNVALVKTPLRQVKSVQELLSNEQARQQISMVVSKVLTPERLMRATANAIRRTPALQECEPISFLGAMMFCAQLGFEPNSPLAQAYLIPFNKNTPVKLPNGRTDWVTIKQVEVVIGYKGFKELARRSGKIKSMHGDIVYEGDVFSHEYGSGQHLRHVPCGRKDKPIGAYFHVAYDGGEGHVYMTKEEIEGHRDRYSKGWQQAVKIGKTADSPWKKDWEAMWIKTPCRILIGRGDIPMSTEMADAITVDEAGIDFRSFATDPLAGPDVIEGEVDEPQPEEEEEAKPELTTATKPKPAEKQESRQSKPKPVQSIEARHVEVKNAQVQDDEPAQGSLLDETRADENGEVIPQEPDWSQNGFGKGFLMDVRDMGIDAAKDLHGDEIARIKDEKPGLHTYLMAEVAKITN